MVHTKHRPSHRQARHGDAVTSLCPLVDRSKKMEFAPNCSPEGVTAGTRGHRGNCQLAAQLVAAHFCKDAFVSLQLHSLRSTGTGSYLDERTLATNGKVLGASVTTTNGGEQNSRNNNLAHSPPLQPSLPLPLRKSCISSQSLAPLKCKRGSSG